MLYGIVHDQVTIRICPEYFTLFHAPMGLADSPTLLAAAWGVRATWWSGLIAGIVLMSVARSGPLPQLTASSLVCPLSLSFGAMSVVAAVAGVAGYVAASRGLSHPPEAMTITLPPERWPLFVADLWAHRASYWTGALSVAGIALWLASVRCRSDGGDSSR